MKYSSIFYAVLLLLISPFVIFAADINLTENSTTTPKIISVEIDTKEETANSLKVAIQVSDNVTVSDINEGDYTCGTFSSTQNGTVIEITCTTKDSEIINSSVAEINFTSSSSDYSFTVLKDQSQIGDLAIVNTTDIGTPILETTSNEPVGTTESTEPTAPTTPTQPTAAPTETAKEKKLTDYLPYLLLGIAGVLLLSIIILLVTKGKKESVTTTTATTTHVTQPPIATPPVEIAKEKPTLQEMVNSGATTTTTQETTTTTTSEINHDKDLEALLMSENPGMTPVIPPVETTTTEAPLSEPLTSEQTVTTTEKTTIETPVSEPFTPPVVETPIETTTTTGTVTTETPLENQTYVANTSEGGLPSIGFTSPTEQPVETTTTTTTETTIPVPEEFPLPNNNSDNYSALYETPTTTQTTSSTVAETTTYSPAQAEIEVAPNQEAADLQALVNSEVSNIPANQSPVTTETTTTTTETTTTEI